MQIYFKNWIKLQLLAISLPFFCFYLKIFQSWIRIQEINWMRIHADPDTQPWPAWSCYLHAAVDTCMQLLLPACSCCYLHEAVVTCMQLLLPACSCCYLHTALVTSMKLLLTAVSCYLHEASLQANLPVAGWRLHDEPEQEHRGDGGPGDRNTKRNWTEVAGDRLKIPNVEGWTSKWK